jgi:hypothetical protein
MNTPCSHLRSFCETGMSRGLANSDFDSSVTGEVGRVYCTAVDLLLISFTAVRDGYVVAF